MLLIGLKFRRQAYLVEVPAEAVLVVGDGGDEREDQAAAAPDLTVARAVLCVLPQRACILLLHADCLLDHHGFPCRIISTLLSSNLNCLWM